MRKKQFSKSLSVAFSENHFEIIKYITDKGEISMAEWVREVVEKALIDKKKENEKNNKITIISDDKDIFIKRSVKEDIEQLESINSILDHAYIFPHPFEEDEENIMPIDELYNYYSCADDPELYKDIYKMSDFIDLLTSEGLDIRESSAHNDKLCLFFN